MPASDAKRMSSGVGVCLVTFVGIEVRCRPEQSGPESHRCLVHHPRILDVVIEVDLLRATVRPVRGTWFGASCTPIRHSPAESMTLCQTLVLDDAPLEDPCPECALRMEVRCVEHDDLTHHSHDRILETDFHAVRLQPGERATGEGSEVAP
jgi:hypothetical protein